MEITELIKSIDFTSSFSRIDAALLSKKRRASNNTYILREHQHIMLKNVDCKHKNLATERTTLSQRNA